jgi:hypothetical protein
MKKHLTWIIAAVFIWIVFFVLKISNIQPEENAAPKESPTPLAHHPPATQQQTNSTPDLTIYQTDPKWVWWNEQMDRDRLFEWKMPISFFGKVVDQDDQPVVGAKIVLQWTDMSDNGTSEQTLFTDSAGRFQLTGVSGKRLAVTQLFKDGYYRANKGIQTSFEYAAFFEPIYHQPDENNPVVFRLRKAGEIPNELVARETMMGIAPTGQPHYIDLQTTRKSSEAQADFAVRITRTAPKEQNRYDWSAIIEGVNGAGLIESDDEFMFEAPQKGYKPAYSYQFAESSPDWESNLKRKYYVEAEGGQVYGRLEIEFLPKYQNTAAIAVRFFVNPTGSRDLEYRPNKVLPR